MTASSESTVDDAFSRLRALGYRVSYGPAISPDDGTAAPALAHLERDSFRDVVLGGRLRSALARLNSKLPAEALEDAYRRMTRTDVPSLVERNRPVPWMLVDGIEAECRREDLPGPRLKGSRHNEVRATHAPVHGWYTENA